MKCVILLFLIGWVAIPGLIAQTVNSNQGQVQVYRDSRLDALVNKHIELNKRENTMAGYRVQIFFDSGINSGESARNAQAKFIEKYLERGVECYITFREPYYRVRVGDFRSRMEAEGFMKEIIRDFPSSFVIKDRIHFPKLSLETVDTTGHTTQKSDLWNEF